MNFCHNFILKAQHKFNNQSGAVTPIIMMMSSILFLSGMAFMDVGRYNTISVIKSNAHIQARYNAEIAARKSLWRFERTDVEDWETWGTFSDSVATAVFDSTTDLLTTVGYHKNAVDTLYVSLEREPVPASEITPVIAYAGNLTVVGCNGTTVYPPESGPQQIEQMPEIDGDYYLNNADYTYTGDQTFCTTLPSGIHYVDGNVNLFDCTVLTGTIVATGTITFDGRVTMNATQTPPASEDYPAYYPAVVSLQSTGIAITGGGPDVYINGVVITKGDVDITKSTLNGMLISNNVILRDSYTINYVGDYKDSPPAITLWTESYTPRVLTWN